MSTDALFSLVGKRALVTGATGHLGVEIVRGLAHAGALVYINSRSEERASEIVCMMKKEGLVTELAVFDVTSDQEVADFLATWDGPLHVLVNNAYAGGAGSIKCATSEQYASAYNVGMIAAHRVFQAFYPYMQRAVSLTGDASVINMASMYGMVSPDPRVYASPEAANPPFYGAAKSALLQWTRYAACEFGPEHIRFNAISPGAFPSLNVQKNNAAFVEKLEDKVPLGRIGCPNELVGPMLFLASKASIYVTGTNLVVDGGWTSW
ncbi:MAG: SDR family oxidoreductase [Gammaproteobacteria bacterium]|nr:SDR family oxidoreductase [Gammaproteobacteria bacterium]